MADFSAKDAGLGYLYQARYALWQLLKPPEEQELVLETLDDIVLDQPGSALDLLQTKHHITPANLTNTSPELWKTLRIWSSHLKEGAINIPPSRLVLVTTAIAAEGSIAATLRPGGDADLESIASALSGIADKSENEALKPAFAAFNSLTNEQRIQLVSAIQILDGSPNISDVADRIREHIRPAVDRGNREAVFERLEGWWFGQVILQLEAKTPTPVTGFEVYDKLRAIADQFKPDALPIDFLEADPGTVDAKADTRMFVMQLRAIEVGLTRIEKAILDYYRAYEQRSRWAREELLVGGEVERYEKQLIDEWQRFAASVADELGKPATELQLEKAGRDIFKWMEQAADIRIRRNVTEPYVMRGSYHILANEAKPRVWWHPNSLKG